MSATLLIVEDDSLIRRSIASRLRKFGHRVHEAEKVVDAKSLLASEDLDLVLVDYRLPDGTGFDVMQSAEENQPGVPCIMLTAHASIEHAVEAMRRGAFTYLQKPVDSEELILQVRKALETGNLRKETRRLRRLRSLGKGADSFLGTSEAAEEVRQMIRQIAVSPARAVLLQGESGTGKGVVARAIHEESERADRSFVPITCSAVPDHLLESELFGHEAGAFTDARKRKMGLLEAADGGTLFLDEIGDMPPGLQAKLLGVLEERRFRPVGGLREIEIDVRVISATHRNLESMVRDGDFREDLLYRLRVIPIRIAPLRERPNDIAELARHFAEEIAVGWGRPALRIAHDALNALVKRDWPGNVRELRNAIERAVILAQGDVLELPSFGEPATRAEGEIIIPPDGIKVERLFDDLVRQALRRTQGNQSAAAKLLGMSRDQVRYRMQKIGLLQKTGAKATSPHVS